MEYDLSILIPARNEEFLPNTVEDIVKNKRGKTEVIVVLDGKWGENGVPMHDDVTVVYLPESIGQRAATNLAAKLSTAKYVMKVDAHCAFDKGFDQIMMDDMQDDWTMVPVMRNLHVFDWVCPEGHRRYQGASGMCNECGKLTEKDVVWIAKESPQSTSYRFNRRLEFKYFGQYKEKQKGDLVDTMSLQGSCFMCTRDKYWELKICDESWGSWGGQGAEVALKTWLSGGRVVCNKKTWYAHMFRTQKDFSFPYPNPGKEQKKAKDTLRNTFLNDEWPLAKRKLQWLVDKFEPVPDWHYFDGDSKRKDKKGAIYYTDNRLEGMPLAKKVREQIAKGMKEKHIVSVTLEPLNFGHNYVLNGRDPGYLTMFEQQLMALEEISAEVVFFLEHDVLYHPSHFDFIPPKKDVFYYNTNVWKMRAEDKHFLRVDDCRQVSGLVAYRDLLLEHYRKRVELVKKNGYTNKMGFEPGTHNRDERVDDYKSDIYHSKYPNIDVRHEKNLTPNRWKKDEYRSRKYTKGWTEADSVEGWNMKELNFLND